MRGVLVGLAVFAACLAGGCSAGAARHPIVISLAPELAAAPAAPTIQVDVIGLTERERREFDAMPISSYWMPGSARRAAVADRAVAVRFGRERTVPVTIAADDPIWEAWRRAGAQWVYVIANLPGAHDDRPGTDDPRRLAVSLRPDAWDEGQEIEIAIRRDGVVCTTPPADGRSSRGQ